MGLEVLILGVWGQVGEVFRGDLSCGGWSTLRVRGAGSEGGTRRRVDGIRQSRNDRPLDTLDQMRRTARGLIGKALPYDELVA